MIETRDWGDMSLQNWYLQTKPQPWQLEVRKGEREKGKKAEKEREKERERAESREQKAESRYRVCAFVCVRVLM